MANGKIIVIEGSDGCGKNTQSEMLLKTLKLDNPKVIKISFPVYEIDSGEMIKKYLKGDYYPNRADYNDIIGACMLYAINRHQSFYVPYIHPLCNNEYPRLIDYYNDGYTIIADRYTSSNILYAASNLWDGTIFYHSKIIKITNTIMDIEYKKMLIPEPDLVLLLHILTESAMKNLLNRYEGDTSKCDKNENCEYLEKVNTALLEYDKYSTEKSIIVDCNKTVDEILPKADIHYKILYILRDKGLAS